MQDSPDWHLQSESGGCRMRFGLVTATYVKVGLIPKSSRALHLNLFEQLVQNGR
jgi:hypothetical protein